MASLPPFCLTGSEPCIPRLRRSTAGAEFVLGISSLHRFDGIIEVSSSVGWFGAVVAFLALALSHLTSKDAQIVHAAYLAMNLIGWAVIVPLSLASL